LDFGVLQAIIGGVDGGEGPYSEDGSTEYISGDGDASCRADIAAGGAVQAALNGSEAVEGAGITVAGGAVQAALKGSGVVEGSGIIVASACRFV